MYNNNNRFKKLKIKIKKKEKKKNRNNPQKCKSPMQRQRFLTTIKNVTEEEKLKSLVRFHSANKINNCNGRRGEGKIFKSMYRTSQNIKIVNVFLESLLSESFPSLGVTVYLTSLG